MVTRYLDMLKRHGLRAELSVEEAIDLFDRGVFLEFIRYAMGSGPELLTSKGQEFRTKRLKNCMRRCVEVY